MRGCFKSSMEYGTCKKRDYDPFPRVGASDCSAELAQESSGHIQPKHHWESYKAVSRCPLKHILGGWHPPACGGETGLFGWTMMEQVEKICGYIFSRKRCFFASRGKARSAGHPNCERYVSCMDWRESRSVFGIKAMEEPKICGSFRCQIGLPWMQTESVGPKEELTSTFIAAMDLYCIGVGIRFGLRYGMTSCYFVKQDSFRCISWRNNVFSCPLMQQLILECGFWKGVYIFTHSVHKWQRFSLCFLGGGGAYVSKRDLSPKWSPDGSAAILCGAGLMGAFIVLLCCHSVCGIIG